MDFTLLGYSLIVANMPEPLSKVVVVSENRSFSGLVLVNRQSREYSSKAVG